MNSSWLHHARSRCKRERREQLASRRGLCRRRDPGGGGPRAPHRNCPFPSIIPEPLPPPPLLPPKPPLPNPPPPDRDEQLPPPPTRPINPKEPKKRATARTLMPARRAFRDRGLVSGGWFELFEMVDTCARHIGVDGKTVAKALDWVPERS